MPRVSRALGRALLAGPRRQVTAVPDEGLSRPGRSRDLAPTLRVQAVGGGEGERRRRSGVCHNPAEAARAPAQRPENACELMASRRFGRSRTREARGRLRVTAPKVAAEAPHEGQGVVTTTDDPLEAADGARGATSLRVHEGGFRRMQRPGRQTRPLAPGRPPRISAPVTRGGLALLRHRAAESRGQQTGRPMRQTLAPGPVVRYRLHGKPMGPRTQVPVTSAEPLRSLGMALPQQMGAVADEAYTPCLS
jgi:hypothetical protein